MIIMIMAFTGVFKKLWTTELLLERSPPVLSRNHNHNSSNVTFHRMTDRKWGQEGDRKIQTNQNPSPNQHSSTSQDPKIQWWLLRKLPGAPCGQYGKHVLLNMQLEIKPNKVLVYTWNGMRSNRENKTSMRQLGGVFSYVLLHITPPSRKMNSKGRRALRKAVRN